jgi:hypothetical protein
MVMTSVVADRHAVPVSEPAEPEVTERASDAVAFGGPQPLSRRRFTLLSKGLS